MLIRVILAVAVGTGVTVSVSVSPVLSWDNMHRACRSRCQLDILWTLHLETVGCHRLRLSAKHCPTPLQGLFTSL